MILWYYDIMIYDIIIYIFFKYYYIIFMIDSD